MRAGTGGTIWPVYSLGSKSSGDRKRPHSPQGSAFWKGAQSPKSTKPMSPKAQHAEAILSAPQLRWVAFFSFPLNIAKNCITHQTRENLSSCRRRQQWHSVRRFKKPVAAHRMLRKWPRTLFGWIFSALTPLSKLTCIFSFFFFFS